MKTNKITAQECYLAHYMRAMDAISKISEKIHDMKAPDSEIDIDWADVGDMERIADELENIHV